MDDYGEAIDFDFRHYLHIDLSEYLVGHRPASEAIRRIGYLPPESATVAQMRADAPGGGSSSAQRPEDRWRGLYGQGPVYGVLADLWDLQAARAGVKGKKGTHPRGLGSGSARRTRRGRSVGGSKPLT